MVARECLMRMSSMTTMWVMRSLNFADAVGVVVAAAAAAVDDDGDCTVDRNWQG